MLDVGRGWEWTQTQNAHDPPCLWSGVDYGMQEVSMYVWKVIYSSGVGVSGLGCMVGFRPCVQNVYSESQKMYRSL